MTAHVKITGTWREITDVYRKIAGVWVRQIRLQRRIAGVWTEVYVPIIIVENNSITADLDLFTLAGSPSYACEVRFTNNNYLYATTPAGAALVVQNFAAGSRVKIINNSYIMGCGGDGGDGGTAGTIAGAAGAAGGPALYITQDVTITNGGGYIFGGGGGGGGGGTGWDNGSPTALWFGGGGGGGGRGYLTSNGGSAVRDTAVAYWACSLSGGGTDYQGGLPGHDGGFSGAGAGGGAWTYGPAPNYYCMERFSTLDPLVDPGCQGGDGGDWGEAGGNGFGIVGGWTGWNGSAAAGSGGAAGKAVDLNGNTVTWISGNDSTRVKGAVS